MQRGLSADCTMPPSVCLIASAGHTCAQVGSSQCMHTIGAVWVPTRLLGRQPPVFVAASTLIVVALFNRVRRPILAWIDRRFYRSHYNAEQVIDSFARQLRNETDTARLTEQLLNAVSETLQPATIGVWVNTERDLNLRERHRQRSTRKEFASPQPPISKGIVHE